MCLLYRPKPDFNWSRQGVDEREQKDPTNIEVCVPQPKSLQPNGVAHRPGAPPALDQYRALGTACLSGPVGPGRRVDPNEGFGKKFNCSHFVRKVLHTFTDHRYAKRFIVRCNTLRFTSVKRCTGIYTIM